MNIINSLLVYLNKNRTFSRENTPEGFCPNCWGKQEYGGNFYDAVKNYKADIKTRDPKVGWIQDYVNENLSGIQLQKKDDKLVCQNCKIQYHPTKV